MNSKFLKTGILLILLGIPVFVLVFLNLFGSNNFDLPRFYPKVDSRDQLIFDASGDTVFHSIDEYELLDQDSLVFNSKSLTGMPYVVSFFFTRCGTICPAMHENLYRVYDSMPVGKLKLLSITVDPENDTPAILKAYSEQKMVNSELWTFLTGEKDEVYKVILNNYKLPVSEASEYDKTIALDETFIHSEKALLIDAGGIVRGIYDATNPADIERLMMEIDILLKGYEK